MPKTSAFTLIELLIVIAILGVLAVIGLASFNSSLARGRDAQRKSDLSTISHALELFNADYGKYPLADASGNIYACPYDASKGTGTKCTWGVDEFRDTDGVKTKTTYVKTLPKDPAKGENYFYRVDSVTTPQKFQIFAHLENSQDQSCLPDATGAPSCTNPANTSSFNCGAGLKCNFIIESPNTSVTDF